MEQRKKDIAFIPAETVFQAIAAIFPDMGSPSKLCQKFVELTENKAGWLYIASCSVVDPTLMLIWILILFDPDQAPTFHPEADLDPSFQIKAQPLEKSAQIGSYSIHFGGSGSSF